MLGLALRVITMLGYPPAIFFGGDSASYLSSSLRLAPGISRLSGYGVMLLLLRPLHSFAVVTGVQHLMGLAVAAAIYAVARRFGLPGWGATLAALPVLFSAYQVQLEHEILPSATFGCLVLAAIALTLWWPAGQRPYALVAAGGLLAVAACFWPVGLPILVLFLGYLALRRITWRVLVAVAAAAIVPLAGYLAWFDNAYNRVAFSNSDGIYLWSRTMSFANCLVIKPPIDEAGLCPHRPLDRRPAASTFIWEPNSPLNNLPGRKFSASKNSLALRFALRAIAAQPGGYLAAVLHDTALAFSWTIPDHPSVLMTRRYEFAYATEHWISPGYPLVPGHTVAQDELDYGGVTSARAVEPFAGWLRAYQRQAYLRGALLGLVLLTGLAGIGWASWGGRRRQAGWGGPGLLPWAASAALIVVPVLTADYSERYVLIAAPTVCLAAALTFARRFPVREAAPMAETTTPALSPQPQPAGGAKA